MNRHHDRADQQRLPRACRLPSRAPGAAERASQAPLEPDCIDGSAARLRGFLAEMAGLAGGAGASLELVVAGLLTVSTPAPCGGLAVLVQLPRSGTRRPRLRLCTAPPGCTLAWHAELGCDLLLRRVPLAALRSEPDVLDAIMDSADLARALLDRA